MKNRIQLILTRTLFLLMIGCQTHVANDAILINKKVDSLIQYCYQNEIFNGSVLVSENGKVTYKNALGMADKELEVTLNTATRFYLASVSKQFTTMAIMILKEQGKLTYEDSLADYFPEIADYAKEVTIRHMMNHTSGIPDHYRLNAYKKGLTNADVLELLSKQEKLDFSPGDRYSYSNGGFVLLSMIVEKASGSPFHIFMKENIFDPLEMKNTLVYDESEPKIKNRAVGYNAMNQKDDYEIFTTGAGGMYSNLDDLFKWDQALYQEKLVTMETMKEAYTPVTLNNGEISNYGFGWAVNRKDQNITVGHSGGMNGYRTYIRRYLSDNNTFIILSNNGDAIEMNEITSALDNILAGNEFDLPKIPQTVLLTELLKDNEPQIAIEQSMKIIEDNPDQYKISENSLNAMGYALMQANDLDVAEAIFKFNIELHPESYNVYDSLGEMQLEKGDTLEAINNYKNSILLNPNNTNGIEILTKLGLSKDEILPEVQLTLEILESYIGKYQLTPDFFITISREGERLFILPTGQSKSAVFPASMTRFYSKIVDAQITFNIDDTGKVTSLTLHQSGDKNAKKVE